MIKIANNLSNLAIKQAGIRDQLALMIPALTGLGTGLTAHHFSEGNLPISVAASLLGSLAGTPLTYLAASPEFKKKIRKNPAEAAGSLSIVF